MDLIPAWIISLVVGFFIKHVKEYGAGVNWTSLKATVAAALAPLPDFLESVCVGAANAAIDVLAQVLQSDHLTSIAEKLAAGDVAGALTELKDLVIALIHPTKPALAKKIADACDEHLCHVQAAA